MTQRLKWIIAVCILIIPITAFSAKLTGKTGRFVIAGQSNASGRGELNRTTESPDLRVLVFGNDYQWRVASEPIDSPIGQVDIISTDSGKIYSTKGHGFALTAAKDLVNTGLDSVVLIPCPKGGSSLTQWKRGANPFDRNTLFGSCYFRTTTAAPRGIDGIWWYQGEADVDKPEIFIAKHTNMINEFRESMGKKLPFVYVQLAKHLEPKINAQQHVIAELQRQMETGSGYPQAIPNHYMVVTFDLPLTDIIHINQTAQKELGRRIALATQEHIYHLAVNGTGPRLKSDKPLQFLKKDPTKISLHLTKPVNPPVNNYDHQFKVFAGDSSIPIKSIERDTKNPSMIILSLDSVYSTPISVSYGDFAAPSTGHWFHDVIQDKDRLPLPQFGPLPVTR